MGMWIAALEMQYFLLLLHFYRLTFLFIRHRRIQSFWVCDFVHRSRLQNSFSEYKSQGKLSQLQYWNKKSLFESTFWGKRRFIFHDHFESLNFKSVCDFGFLDVLWKIPIHFLCASVFLINWCGKKHCTPFNLSKLIESKSWLLIEYIVRTMLAFWIPVKEAILYFNYLSLLKKFPFVFLFSSFPYDLMVIFQVLMKRWKLKLGQYLPLNHFFSFSKFLDKE